MSRTKSYRGDQAFWPSAPLTLSHTSSRSPKHTLSIPRLFGTPSSHRATLFVLMPFCTFLALGPPIFLSLPPRGPASDLLTLRLPPFDVPPLTLIFLYPLTRTL